jgi:hypothetical protein
MPLAVVTEIWESCSRLSVAIRYFTLAVDAVSSMAARMLSLCAVGGSSLCA